MTVIFSTHHFIFTSTVRVCGSALTVFCFCLTPTIRASKIFILTHVSPHCGSCSQIRWSKWISLLGSKGLAAVSDKRTRLSWIQSLESWIKASAGRRGALRPPPAWRSCRGKRWTEGSVRVEERWSPFDERGTVEGQRSASLCTNAFLNAIIRPEPNLAELKAGRKAESLFL